VGQKSDTSRTLHYIVREVSLFWPTLYIANLSEIYEVKIKIPTGSAVHSSNNKVKRCNLHLAHRSDNNNSNNKQHIYE